MSTHTNMKWYGFAQQIVEWGPQLPSSQGIGGVAPRDRCLEWGRGFWTHLGWVCPRPSDLGCFYMFLHVSTATSVSGILAKFLCPSIKVKCCQHLEANQHDPLMDDTQNVSRSFFKNVSRSLAAHLHQATAAGSPWIWPHSFLPQGHPDAQGDIYPRMCASGRVGKPLALPWFCDRSQVALLAPIWRGMWCAATWGLGNVFKTIINHPPKSPQMGCISHQTWGGLLLF